ncbi:hypothetical protein BX616_006224, partial [Lobosporangium transversale]
MMLGMRNCMVIRILFHGHGPKPVFLRPKNLTTLLSTSWPQVAPLTFADASPTTEYITLLYHYLPELAVQLSVFK